MCRADSTRQVRARRGDRGACSRLKRESRALHEPERALPPAARLTTPARIRRGGRARRSDGRTRTEQALPHPALRARARDPTEPAAALAWKCRANRVGLGRPSAHLCDHVTTSPPGRGSSRRDWALAARLSKMAIRLSTVAARCRGSRGAPSGLLSSPGSLRSRSCQGFGSNTLGPRRDRRSSLGPPGRDDEIVVADGVGAHSLFEKPVEEEPALARRATVEAEAELVEVGLEVVAFDGSLVGREQPALHEGGEAVHAGARYVGGQTRTGDIDGLVDLERADGDRVGLQSVADDHRARLDVVGQEPLQRRSRGIGYDLEPTAAETPRAPALHGDRHERLSCRPTSTLAGLHATDGGLVDLDVAESFSRPGFTIAMRRRWSIAQAVS